MKEQILELTTPLGQSVPLFKNTWGSANKGKTLSIVGGLRGNQFNGMRLLARLSGFLDAVEKGEATDYKILGNIQVFPLANLFAVQGGTRNWAFDNLDFDLAFPGYDQGEPTDRIARCLYRHTLESDFGLAVHSYDSRYQELAHARLFHGDRKARKLADGLGLRVVREIRETSVSELQLISHWRDKGVAALMLCPGETGTLDTGLCENLFGKLVDLMIGAGVLAREGSKPEPADVSLFTPKDETELKSACAGLFIPDCAVGDELNAGDKLGEIRDIYSGELLEEIVAPVKGLLVGLRVYPLVYQNEALATVVAKKSRWPFSF